jgi:dTDP-glucose 4,6-dehydratase
VPAPRRALEDDPLAPSSPYAAAKAGADLLVLAAVRTYGVDASIVRGANAYGPYQFPEKLVSLLTVRALRGEPLPIYGDGLQEREFTHVIDFASAIASVLARGEAGVVYNASAEEPQVNLETARRIVALAGASPDLIEHVADRPGHDRRYAIGCGRLRALGWTPRMPFADGLPLTVRWYAANEDWWRPILGADGYASFVAANYDGRRRPAS